MRIRMRTYRGVVAVEAVGQGRPVRKGLPHLKMWMLLTFLVGAGGWIKGGGRGCTSSI